jgi:hypothetical protein
MEQRAKGAERELKLKDKELETQRRAREKAVAEATQSAEKQANVRQLKLQETHKQKVGKLETAIQELEKKTR